MLVVPDHWGAAPIAGNAGFRTKLRRWADQGVEMFVHGWFHRDDRPQRGIAGLKARHLTAGEGEFSGMDRAEAARRMADGRALIEDCIGRKVAGFIAPAWLYSCGANAALPTITLRWPKITCASGCPKLRASFRAGRS